ncbi:MAG: metalloregulator ArsR/SmtB family transcription factor [Candidatus Diapherotrites archaeon]|nr:metalloregulator ArsR/SmtB family transcription factor [Candidatus Diapherotrites archaeon]
MNSGCYLFFETLATRLKSDIIETLDESPLSVSELAGKLRQERSKVSHALLSLEECGFVKAEKKGKSRIYFLNKQTMRPLLRLIEKHTQKNCRICKKHSG